MFNNYSTNNSQGEENKYINYNYVNKIKNKENFNINEMTQINVGNDGNCFMRCMALFVYKNENYYFRVRSEICQHLKRNRINYQNLEIDTEEGLKFIDDYIIYIQKDGIYSGELEKYACQSLYNINICDYKEIKNQYFIPIYHQFIYNLNQDNNYNKDLCILTQVNNNHYNLLFDKNYNAYVNNKFELIINLYHQSNNLSNNVTNNMNNSCNNLNLESNNIKTKNITNDNLNKKDSKNLNSEEDLGTKKVNQKENDSKIDEIYSDNENDIIEFKNLNYYEFKEQLIDLKKKH